jgi:hypothetical protein
MVYQHMLVRSNSRLYVIDVLHNPDSGKDLTDDYIAGCLTRCRADAAYVKLLYRVVIEYLKN